MTGFEYVTTAQLRNLEILQPAIQPQLLLTPDRPYGTGIERTRKNWREGLL